MALFVVEREEVADCNALEAHHVLCGFDSAKVDSGVYAGFVFVSHARRPVHFQVFEFLRAEKHERDIVSVAQRINVVDVEVFEVGQWRCYCHGPWIPLVGELDSELLEGICLCQALPYRRQHLGVQLPASTVSQGPALRC